MHFLFFSGETGGSVKQCTYRYGDGHRCVFNLVDLDDEMCKDHKEETRIKRKQRRVDMQRQRVLPDNPAVVYYDHTAPWHCALEGCDICKDKPTQKEYMTKKFGEKVK